MIRPQPLGVLPLPAGWLVLPDAALADEAGRDARDRLLSGMLPLDWPASLDFLRLAAEGRFDDAAKAVDPAAGVQDAYNHFVLTGEEDSLGLARAGAAAAGQEDGDLAVLVEVAAYALGRDGVLPDAEQARGGGPEGGAQDGGGLDGEVAAHLLAAHAARCLEHSDPQGALDALVAAESAARPVSPVLAAMLLGQQAALLQEVNGADDDVVAAYREAGDALRGLDAVETAAGELALGLATACQEIASHTGNQGMLVEAVRGYHLALRMLRKDSQPERYAFAHSNLALAYLAMPMTDAREKLRRGVAVQSLREALTYYGKDTHPREWASVTLNLANALQHLPTTHPVENLVEAVGMYDELLEVRTREVDPLGHARVLANQGTALSHLGIHDQARGKLLAAQEIFDLFGESAASATVDAALAEIDAVTATAAPAPSEV